MTCSGFNSISNICVLILLYCYQTPMLMTRLSIGCSHDASACFILPPKHFLSSLLQPDSHRQVGSANNITYHTRSSDFATLQQCNTAGSPHSLSLSISRNQSPWAELVTLSRDFRSHLLYQRAMRIPSTILANSTSPRATSCSQTWNRPQRLITLEDSRCAVQCLSPLVHVNSFANQTFVTFLGIFMFIHGMDDALPTC